MKKLSTVILLFISITGSAHWVWDEFTGEERAFFYNITRRTEILKPELFHLFEFTDSIPWVNDTLPDYAYVEKQVVKYPEKLILHQYEMLRKPVGLISDLALAYAIWELDRVLHYRQSTDEKDKPLKEKQKVFEKYIMENIPQTALTVLTSGEFVLQKGIYGYLSPSLTISDKLASLVNSGYTQMDQMLIANAISSAQEKYVHLRAGELMHHVGYTKDIIRTDFISAAGDGSSYSDLEGSFKTPYNHTIPDERNLYFFEAEEFVEKELKPDGEEILKKPIIRVKDIRVREFRTSTDKATVLHFDVQGYHPERQTTIAIQKGGASYILYGKNDHRLVSPDSSYGTGTTYWRLLWELEHFYIDDLNEKLYGKRGYDYWIDVYEKKMKNTELLIKKTEFKLDQLRHQPAGQPKMKKKKIKNKNLDNSDQINGHPTNTLTKTEKKMNIEQNRLVHLNTQWENEKAMLEKLKKEMEEAYILLVKYQTLYDKMQKNLGYIFMAHEQEGDIFTFSDGAIFNYATQDFIFPKESREEVFHVYHISFGERVLSTRIEETFIHMNLSYVNLKDRCTLEKLVYDKQESGMSLSDSIQTQEIFMAILQKNLPVEIQACAGGIVGNPSDADLDFFRDSSSEAIVSGGSGYNFKNDGFVMYRADKTNKISLSVTVWNEKSVTEKFSAYQAKYLKFHGKYPGLNEADFYCGIRANYLATRWIEELKSLATKWYKKPAEQAKILKALNTLSVKSVWFENKKVKASVPEYLN